MAVADGRAPGLCPNLGQLGDMDRYQALLSQTARFAASYLRWLDANRPDGLTFQRLMLIRSLHCGGPAIMSELASALGVSARNITAIVDGLEREHLVARRPHPTDRRATLVELTTDGGATVDTSLDPAIEALGELFAGLDPAEQQRFLVTITRLTGAMESSADCSSPTTGPTTVPPASSGERSPDSAASASAAIPPPPTP